MDYKVCSIPLEIHLLIFHLMYVHTHVLHPHHSLSLFITVLNYSYLQTITLLHHSYTWTYHSPILLLYLDYHQWPLDFVSHTLDFKWTSFLTTVPTYEPPGLSLLCPTNPHLIISLKRFLVLHCAVGGQWLTRGWQWRVGLDLDTVGHCPLAVGWQTPSVDTDTILALRSSMLCRDTDDIGEWRHIRGRGSCEPHRVESKFHDVTRICSMTE